MVFRQQLVVLKCYGGKFVVDVNDHLGYMFFVNDGFDSLVLQIADLLEIDENSILLDIGANIGSTCIPFAIKFNAEVIAVEASKQNAILLLRNSFLNNVKIWPHIVCAVDPTTAETDKWLRLFNQTGNFGANSIFETWLPSKSGSNFEFSRTATIDSILSNVDLNRIKIIKIDVEGAETMVLRGFKKISSIHAPLLFEYRSDVMRQCLNLDGAELLEMIRENFDVYAIVTEGDRMFLEEFEPLKSYANAIAFPKSDREYFVKRFSFK